MTKPTTASLLTYLRQGTMVIEGALAKAVAADPQNVPMAFTGTDAQLYHQGAADAYRHTLEMMEPGDELDVVSWREGEAVIKQCLAVSAAGDWLDAPMPLHGDGAKVYLQGRTDAFAHGLEMMGYPEDATEETLQRVNVHTTDGAPVLVMAS